ncbi:CaiB/BaiF CoA transferase family protein [Bowmanella pacifica]|uniref:CoA transferase n=1 Tax=Bowmanella pacifica TaxID=502051 RepID=A0A917Z4W2_9ALTE|nr:CaiB/BaiF CoA-transferase family protein [Bowmanella pacifica]GGO72934.1 CoA transferase [Bowmanella pacifica]
MSKSAILKDVVVLELAFMATGPMCGSLLADLGAQVVKIEPPKGGDMFRFMPPFGQTEVEGEKVNGSFLSINRNKRSVALNYRKGLGKEALLTLIKQADVLIEGFKPGSLEKWGLDYESLRLINPRLIYCHISGYGMTGPDASKMQHEGNLSALSGLLDSFSPASGVPHLAPGLSMVGAYTALSGILAALLHRTQTGQGQLVDISVLDALMGLQAPAAGEQLNCDDPRHGEAFIKGEWPRNALYACACGQYLYFGAGEHRYYQGFLQQLGREDILAIPEPQQQTEALRTLFLSRSRADWLTDFGNTDYCISPVNSLTQALEDPQVQARQPLFCITSPTGKQHISLGNIIKLSAHPAPAAQAAPLLGQHSTQVLREFGLSEAQIQALQTSQQLTQKN